MKSSGSGRRRELQRLTIGAEREGPPAAADGQGLVGIRPLVAVDGDHRGLGPGDRVGQRRLECGHDVERRRRGRGPVGRRRGGGRSLGDDQERQGHERGHGGHPSYSLAPRRGIPGPWAAVRGAGPPRERPAAALTFHHFRFDAGSQPEIADSTESRNRRAEDTRGSRRCPAGQGGPGTRFHRPGRIGDGAWRPTTLEDGQSGRAPGRLVEDGRRRSGGTGVSHADRAHLGHGPLGRYLPGHRDGAARRGVPGSVRPPPGRPARRGDRTRDGPEPGQGLVGGRPHGRLR